MCSGPYHSATSSGSVHALKTRSRGASKTCVIRTCCSVIRLSLLAQMRVESFHPGGPRPLACFDPFGRVVERVGLQPARPPLGVPSPDDQSGVLEHPEVA